MSSARIAILGIVAALATSALAAPAGSIMLERDGKAVWVPLVRPPGDAKGAPSDFVSLKSLASALGGKVARAGAKEPFELTLRSSKVRISPDYPAIALWDDRVVSLSCDARIAGKDVLVPVDFISRIIDPILRGSTTPGPARTGGIDKVAAVAASSPAGPLPRAGASPASAVGPAQAAVPGSPRGATLAPAVAGEPGTFTVVLDPGHGGGETGAAGKSGVFEKALTLEIAARLKALLEKQPGMIVVLTRETDMEVTLTERTALANRSHAQLFLSIHLNSAPRRGARGAETWFLSMTAKDEEARTISAIENNAAGVDPATLAGDSNNLQLVLWDLAQAQYLAESSELAQGIQKELNDALGVRDRGVKQAPFTVLMGATMPAVLVEVGFISNPEEEAKLTTADYQDRIAQALSRAVLAFRAQDGQRLAGQPPAR